MPQTSSRAGGWNEPGLVKVGTEGPVPVGGEGPRLRKGKPTRLRGVNFLLHLCERAMLDPAVIIQGDGLNLTIWL